MTDTTPAQAPGHPGGWKFGDETEYRIEFQIQRRRPGDEDFTEIGFGSSGACGDVDDAMYAASSYVQNGQWETSDGMPDPEEVTAEIAAAREEGHRA